jgi:hypothetical protein
MSIKKIIAPKGDYTARKPEKLFLSGFLSSWFFSWSFLDHWLLSRGSFFRSGFSLWCSLFGYARSSFGSLSGLSLLAGDLVLVQDAFFSGFVEFALNFIECLYGFFLVASS